MVDSFVQLQGTLVLPDWFIPRYCCRDFFPLTLTTETNQEIDFLIKICLEMGERAW